MKARNIVLFLCLVFLLSACKSDKEHFRDGFDQGRVKGYQEGHSKGYKDGKNYGYRNGYNDGKIDGYNSGFKEGERRGYVVGKDVGKVEGFKTGKEEGFKTGKIEGNEEGFKTGKIEGYKVGNSEGVETGYKKGHEEGEQVGYVEGSMFLISESMFPTLGGWVVIIAIIIITILALRYFRTPVEVFIKNTVDDAEERREQKYITNEIRRRTLLASELSAFKSQALKIENIDSYSKEEYKAIQDNELTKLQDHITTKLHDKKNEYVINMAKEYQSLLQKIKDSENMTSKEKTALYKKLDVSFEKKIVEIERNNGVTLWLIMKTLVVK